MELKLLQFVLNMMGTKCKLLQNEILRGVKKLFIHGNYSLDLLLLKPARKKKSKRPSREWIPRRFKEEDFALGLPKIKLIMTKMVKSK